MATLIWIGGTSTDSATLANWKDQSTGLAPTTIAISDDFLFNDEATDDCSLNQTQIGTITVLGDAFSPHTLIYNSTTLTIDSIRYTGATKIKFAQSTTTITFTGTHSTSTPQFGHPILVEGSIAYDATGNGKETCLLKLKNTGGSASFFTNGDLSKIQIVSGIFTTNPNPDITGTHGKLETPFLQIDNGTTFSNSDIGLDDTQKHIQVTGLNQATQYFKCDAEILDFSNAKLTIDARSPAGTVIQYLPCTNDETNYGTGGEFIALLEDVVVGNNSGNGHQIGIPEGLTLHCDTLEIQSGSMLLGGGTTQTANKSNINCIGKITIRGTWNFEETSDGIYSSIGGTTSQSKYKLTANNVHILDKLTVDGLIDPTGMEFTAVGSNPGTDAAKTIWVNSSDSNKLYFGSSEVGGGGGGAVSSVFGRTGAVVATEGDYDLDELGDVDVTSAVETQILRHDGTSFVNDYNDVFFLRVKAREAINKGEAVYIFDAHNSNVVGVKKARANSSTTMPCIGIAYETLALGDEGLIVAFGKANGITANFTEGQTMYVSPTTAGALTNTKPTGNTELIQNVGILMQAHASNAVVKVTGVGRTNDVPNQFSVGGSITAGSFVKSGGASTEFLKADGSVDTSTYLTSFTEADPIFGASEAFLFATGDKVKLDGIESGAEVNVGLEYARWYGKNTGSNLYSVSSGGRQYLDLADTTKFGESSTGTHSNITLVNASTDYITLTKGGIYQIVISLESFPSSTVSTHDRWIEVNTNSSANRALGTARMQNTGSSNGNWNAQKTVVHEIPSTGSDVDVYISFLTNGTGSTIRAYDDNRISVAITRLGDASV